MLFVLYVRWACICTVYCAIALRPWWVARLAHMAAWSQNGHTALMCAAESGHVDCARLLLDAGADMNAKDVVRACC